MSEELKAAKGFCAWHPEQGFAVFTVSEHESACWTLLAHSYEASWLTDEDIEAFKAGEGTQWLIVPIVITRAEQQDGE